MTEAVSVFLDALSAWAAQQPGIAAAALVGSQARGEAAPGSDVDLVILGDEQALLADCGWAGQFGDIRQLGLEDYGAVTSLRVHYATGSGIAGGLEVEYGIANPSWAQPPLDPGTAEVVEGGRRILHDPQGLLARLANPG
jgi:hypothetical protein